MAFKIPKRTAGAPPAASAPPPGSVADFAAGAALVQSQLPGRALKPVRINFDVDPDCHERITARAKADGGIANMMRRLIAEELARPPR